MSAKKGFTRGVSIIIMIMLSGCANLGAKAIKGTQISYNMAIQNTSDQQLLLNLARMRYRDTPLFMEVSSVSAQLRFEVGANASATLQPGADEHGLGGSVQYTETPTISYTPLQGDDFVKRLLTPIAIEKLVLLSNSGWSVERIMRVCVQRLDDLRNALRASGPTPSAAPEYKEFNELARLLRELQLQNALELTYQDSNKRIVPVLLFDIQAADAQTLRRTKDLLKIKQQNNAVALTSRKEDDFKESITINTRSLLGVLFYLSQAIDIPDDHKNLGMVTTTLASDGTPFVWPDVTKGLFHVKSSTTRPKSASTTVFFREHWFYIDDTDLTSKSTFAFLSQLFALQAGSAESVKPVLTLPIGN